MKLVAFAAVCGGCLLTPGAPTCDGPYGAPVKLYEVESDQNDDAPWLSRDRLELVFASERDGQWQIFRTTRTTPDGLFAPPVAITDGSHFEQNPFVTADGLTLYYYAINAPGSTVYLAKRSSRDAPFQPDEPLLELNGVGALSMTDDQLDMFTDPASGQDQQISTSHRTSVDVPFPPHHPIDLGPDNYSSPAISGDGAVLLVNHGHDIGGTFVRQLARSERQPDGTYSPAVEVPGLDVGSYDGSTIDDDIIIYTGNGEEDLFTIERSCR